MRGDFVRFAIDRFYSGTEKEVRASEFYNTYIPQKKTRFYCPECGEHLYNENEEVDVDWNERDITELYKIL